MCCSCAGINQLHDERCSCVLLAACYAKCLSPRLHQWVARQGAQGRHIKISQTLTVARSLHARHVLLLLVAYAVVPLVGKVARRVRYTGGVYALGLGNHAVDRLRVEMLLVIAH